jgi:hypothetical protein
MQPVGILAAWELMAVSTSLSVGATIAFKTSCGVFYFLFDWLGFFFGFFFVVFCFFEEKEEEN